MDLYTFQRERPVGFHQRNGCFSDRFVIGLHDGSGDGAAPGKCKSRYDKEQARLRHICQRRNLKLRRFQEPLEE